MEISSASNTTCAKNKKAQIKLIYGGIFMNFSKAIVLGLSILGLISNLAQARPAGHRRHHSRPRVSVGFNICRPMVVYARPYYVRPCCPYLRPHVGVSFGGPSFGFGFSI